MKSKKITRCPWSESTDMMKYYHDTEWGKAKHNDQQHFEFLILEAAQAGLSWATVLKRREGYRKAFANFDPKKVAKFNKKKIADLLKNPEIIRNRLKVEAVVHNAPLFLEVQKEFGTFDKYMWSFVDHRQIDGRRKKQSDYQATSPESDALSKDLKKRGFKFVGSTVIYAHMQAVGMINDHLQSCFCYKKCLENNSLNK